MKFFTPELYLRFNSPDDEEADRADAEWEAALQSYKQHLDHLRAHMPPRVQQLADRLCLHDAELVHFEEVSTEAVPFWRNFAAFPHHFLALLSLRIEGAYTVLVYALWQGVRRYPPPEGWPFSAEKVHVLYDEVDEDEQGHGTFWHRILWSDGSIFEIPFFDIILQEMAPHASGKAGAASR
jgi:hypothetical protein